MPRAVVRLQGAGQARTPSRAHYAHRVRAPAGQKEDDLMTDNRVCQQRIGGVLLAGVTLLGALAGCSKSSSPPKQQHPDSDEDHAPSRPAKPLVITSPAFAAGERIPTRYTEEGANASPPLRWSGVPESAAELALICDDPDAPRDEPWVHWVMYKIPASAGGLPDGIPRAEKVDEPAGALQGRNSWPHDNIGYRGPMPPKGSGAHNYHFKLYAVDTPLSVPGGLTKAELLKAMRGHVLAEGELVGTYERK
jgi:Raf kinase inhibitor-like YbhB/YbcL family protein